MGNSSSGSDDNNATATTTRLGEGKYALGGHRAFFARVIVPAQAEFRAERVTEKRRKGADVAQPPYREGSRARRRRV